MTAIARCEALARCLAFLLTFVWVGAAAQLPEGLPTVRIAHPFEESSDQRGALSVFSQAAAFQQLAAIQPVPTRELGPPGSSLLSAVRAGRVDMAIVPFAVMANELPPYGVFTTPFLFRDFRHLAAVQSGEPGRRMLDQLRLRNVVGVGWWAGEFLALGGRQPVVEPGDIRSSIVGFQPLTSTQQHRSTAMREFSDVLGAKAARYDPVPGAATISNAGSDVFEGTLEQLSRLASAPRFITLSRHLNDGYVVIANPRFWSALPRPTRLQLQQSFETARRVAYVAFERREERILRQPPGGAAALSWTRTDRSLWQRRSGSLDASRARLGALVDEVQDYPILQPVSGQALAARISWNVWLEDSEGKDTRAIPVGETAHVALDLGRQPYSRSFSAGPDPALGQRLARLAAGQSISLLVQPILLGGSLVPAPGFALRPQLLQVSGARAAARVNDETAVQAYRDGRLPARALSSDLGLVDALRWTVKGSRAGCADVAFVIWDAARSTPLDHVVVSIPVNAPGQEMVCYGKRRSVDMAAGMETLLERPSAPGLRADAALHVFEFNESGSPRSVAVLVDAKQLEASRANPASQESGIYAWELASPLSHFVSDAKQLPKLVTEAHQRLTTGAANPYADVVYDMLAVLFGGNADADRLQATAAKEAFKKVIAEAAMPRVLVRIVDEHGRPIYLPLGLLAAGATRGIGFVPKRFTVIQTLLGARSSVASCIASWHVGRSTSLQGAVGEARALLETAPGTLPAPAQLLKTHQAVAQYVGSQPSMNRGEGFLMLAHHDEGTLRFSSGDRPPPWIRSDYINRTFPSGSFALLAACSTSGAGEQTSAIVNRLAARGVESMVLSPFPVDIDYGVRLALAFENQVVAELAKPTGATAVMLFERSASAVAAALPGVSALQDMGLEFQLVGEPDLQLCDPGR